MHYVHTIVKDVVDVLFPPFCEGCGTPQTSGFCPCCCASLQLLPLDNRCPKCFRLTCICTDEPISTSACFEETEISQKIFATQPEGGAGFIVVQHHRLAWPIADVIIPTPFDWFSTLPDRKDVRVSLAREVASLFQRPYCNVARINRSKLSIPYISLEEQPHMPPLEAVYIRHPKAIVNKRVLVIHDTLVTGHSTQATAQALLAYGARAVQTISLLASSSNIVWPN